MPPEIAIIEIEEQLYTTLDAAERHRLLKRLIKILVRFAKESDFLAIVARRIGEGNKRINRQRELVARLKASGHDTSEAYFMLITLKTAQALFTHHDALAREILVCIVPRNC